MMAAQGTAARGAGKSAQSIGQLAKAAVAVAREARADLPSNAQGLAASAAARGIDPASLFAARVEEKGGGADVAPVAPDPVPDVIAAGPLETKASAGTQPPTISDAEVGPVFLPKPERIISEDPSVALLQE